MDDKRSQDSELWQMIDAARPASDDLTLPEFARAAALNRENPQVRAVSQRSQRLDLAIGDALQDLPVPAGAVERLLSALTNSATSTHEPSAIPTSKAGETAHSNDIPAPTAKTPLLAPERSVPASNPSSDLHSELTGVGSKATGVGDAQDAAAEHDAHNEARRRRRLGSSWGAMSVAVVVVLLAVIILRPRGGELGPNGVLNDDWLFAVDENEFEQLPMDRAPPARYRFDNALTVKPTAWRPIAGLLQRPHGVAYQLRSAVAQATLYVTDAEAGLEAPRLGELPSAPPPEAPVKTGGKAMSAWQQAGLLYVLVVRGADAEYHSFVTASGQLATRECGRSLPALFAFNSTAATFHSESR